MCVCVCVRVCVINNAITYTYKERLKSVIKNKYLSYDSGDTELTAFGVS